MSIIIKGYITKLIFHKEDFKIYGFAPNNECLDKVVLSKYGSITIKGIMPELIDGKEYEIEVEYENNGKYETYNLIRFLTNLSDIDTQESFSFLNSLVGEVTATNIISVYPNFIKLLIDGKENEIDIGKIKGVKEKKLKLIKEKVEENFKFLETMTYYSDYNLTINQIRALYNKFRSFDMIKEKMDENPYNCLCSVSGIGFKTADMKILNKNKQLANSKYRMCECILYVLKENENKGNTYMYTGELTRECAKLTPECMNHIKDVVKNNDYIFYDSKLKVAAIKSTYNCEKEVCDIILELLNNSFEIKCNGDYTTIDGFKLTDKQTQIQSLLKKYNICILAGNAGTGKTSSTKSVTNMLLDAKMSFKLLAPTGKASKVLTKCTGYQAETIHRGLVYDPLINGFQYNEDNKLPYDVIIVDEATMVDIFLMRSLLRAIDTKRTKLMFICDPAQIPSIGCGNCMQDMINVIPTAMLDTVFRYGEGGLSYVATKTRNGEKFLNSNCTEQQVFGKNKDFVFIPKPKEEIQTEVVKVYKKLVEEKGIDKDDIVILTSFNKGNEGTYALNSKVQDYINPYNEINNEVNYFKDKQNIKFRVGDKIINTVNSYNIDIESENDNNSTTNIFNGDEGNVVEIDNKGIIAEFYGEKIYYSNANINKLLLDYSISSHKSQGSSYEYVICVVPPSHKYFLNRNLLYVMLTRAKQKVFMIGTIDTVETALKKSENLSRQTFLHDILKQKIN